MPVDTERCPLCDHALTSERDQRLRYCSNCSNYIDEEGEIEDVDIRDEDVPTWSTPWEPTSVQRQDILDAGRPGQ